MEGLSDYIRNFAERLRCRLKEQSNEVTELEVAQACFFFVRGLHASLASTATESHRPAVRGQPEAEQGLASGAGGDGSGTSDENSMLMELEPVNLADGSLTVQQMQRVKARIRHVFDGFYDFERNRLLREKEKGKEVVGSSTPDAEDASSCCSSSRSSDMLTSEEDDVESDAGVQAAALLEVADAGHSPRREVQVWPSLLKDESRRQSSKQGPPSAENYGERDQEEARNSKGDCSWSCATLDGAKRLAKKMDATSQREQDSRLFSGPTTSGTTTTRGKQQKHDHADDGLQRLTLDQFLFVLRRLERLFCAGREVLRSIAAEDVHEAIRRDLVTSGKIFRSTRGIVSKNGSHFLNLHEPIGRPSRCAVFVLGQEVELECVQKVDHHFLRWRYSLPDPGAGMGGSRSRDEDFVTGDAIYWHKDFPYKKA
ncbi:unnamed protein product [Amoebophrya sp. A120]|nr:unnamed protein product [Amoebophrya sp. A120]|eukprot:GSA120T00023042001.1